MRIRLAPYPVGGLRGRRQDSVAKGEPHKLVSLVSVLRSAKLHHPNIWVFGEVEIVVDDSVGLLHYDHEGMLAADAPDDEGAAPEGAPVGDLGA